jgi:ABC-type branched-subunit amino acid transport system substrate-binding protein
MVRLRSGVVVALTLLVLAAACSSDKKNTSSTGSSGATSSSSVSSAELTDSFRGVTKTSIKIGIVTVKFTDCILQFTNSTQGDAEKIEKALVDDINKNGGVDGRQLQVVFKELCPLHPDEVAAACTSLTDDEQVFAVLGVYDTEPGDGTNQLCISKDHETVQINELAFQKALDEAPPGLLISPSIAQKRVINALFGLLKAQGTLKGKKVAALTDQTRADVTTKAVSDNASALGYTTGSNAVLSISGADTTAAQTQFDSFIEKWKSEGVDTVLLGGLSVADRQFIDKLKKAIPSIQLISDDSGSGNFGQTENKADTKVTPNSYEGMLVAQGLSDAEQFATDPVQKCVKVYEAATGETVIGPADLKPDASGNLIKVYEGIQDRCRELSLFKQIAEKAGPNLTNDTWINAVNNFGEIQLVGNKFASLGNGKYDAPDGFRLAAFDSTIQPFGDFKPLGDLIDVTKQ